MRNGYFQLVNADGRCALKIIPPQGGESLLLNEVSDYMHAHDLPLDPVVFRTATESVQEQLVYIRDGECPPIDETFKITISEDRLYAQIRFIAPSETGKRITKEDVLFALKQKNVIYGIDETILEEHFSGEPSYCTNLSVARGTPARQGKDAQIKYFFTQDIHARPTIREDGSVDFFQLNTVSHCRKGDILAQVIPEDPGEYGRSVDGAKVKPRDVKRLSLKFGPKVELSPDKMTIRSAVDGHVTLIDDKVFVSDILSIENVGTSTGNIDFEGSVEISGNVQSNFKVKAKGTISIGGVVEGASVEAGEDIIIARGMNGMGKGELVAGRNIISQFLEGVKATAGGSVTCGAIMHSIVKAGEEVEVTGKKGLISGGHISALKRIKVKTLGSELGTNTIVEVGANPQTKERYHVLHKEIARRVKEIRDSQPLLENFVNKQAKGHQFTDAQKSYVIGLAKEVKRKRLEIGSMNLEMHELQEVMDINSNSSVVVTGVVHPGVKVVIGDVSTAVQTAYKYCKFEKVRGDIKANAI
ncbi:MAG: FapA family protein [Lachnospiraceae bacterium]|jgi:uncharacterized protein (DUF342 family)|nr:FapA family protein [Lachnospiraceae bacterium]